MLLLKSLIFLLILLFPFGQLTRLPSLSFLQIHLYLQDLIIGVLIISWLTYHFFSKKPLPNPPLTKPLFLFSIIALLSLMVNFPRLILQESIISSLYLLRWFVFATLYFIVYEIILSSPSPPSSPPPPSLLLRLLTLAGTFTAIFGLLQYLLYPNLRNLYYLGWDPHENRLFGTFFDPGFSGIILVLSLILTASLLLNKKCQEGLFLKIAWLLIYAALALTYSRSSYLAFLTGMTTLGFLKKSWKFIFGIFIIFFLTISFLPRPSGEGTKLERTSTVNARLKNYQQTLTIIKEHPLFGVGFNSLRYSKRDYGFLEKDNWQETHSGAGADSSLLFVWATAGVFGLFAYLWLWWKILTMNQWAQIVIPTAIALLTHSLFLNSLFYPWIMLWLWLILGINHAVLNNRLITR